MICTWLGKITPNLHVIARRLLWSRDICVSNFYSIFIFSMHLSPWQNPHDEGAMALLLGTWVTVPHQGRDGNESTVIQLVYLTLLYVNGKWHGRSLLVRAGGNGRVKQWGWGWADRDMRCDEIGALRDTAPSHASQWMGRYWNLWIHCNPLFQMRWASPGMSRLGGDEVGEPTT